MTETTRTTAYETILVERKGRTALLTLNRPKALNALNLQVMNEVVAATEAFDRDPEIGCIVLTGSARAFAAGADIKEMQPQGYMDMYLTDWFTAWDRLGELRTPTVAAVCGYALGGGCELGALLFGVGRDADLPLGGPVVRLQIGVTDRPGTAVAEEVRTEVLRVHPWSEPGPHVAGTAVRAHVAAGVGELAPLDQVAVRPVPPAGRAGQVGDLGPGRRPDGRGRGIPGPWPRRRGSCPPPADGPARR